MTDNNRIILCNKRHHPSEADLCVKGSNGTWRTMCKFCYNSKDQQEYELLSGGAKNVLNFKFQSVYLSFRSPCYFSEIMLGSKSMCCAGEQVYHCGTVGCWSS